MLARPTIRLCRASEIICRAWSMYWWRHAKMRAFAQQLTHCGQQGDFCLEVAWLMTVRSFTYSFDVCTMIDQSLRPHDVHILQCCARGNSGTCVLHQSTMCMHYRYSACMYCWCNTCTCHWYNTRSYYNYVVCWSCDSNACKSYKYCTCI